MWIQWVDEDEQNAPVDDFGGMGGMGGMEGLGGMGEDGGYGGLGLSRRVCYHCIRLIIYRLLKTWRG